MTLKDYELHELTELFPAMQDEEFDFLKASIALTGFDPTEPITLWQGKVIDGRHRLLACQELGVEPAVYVLADDVDAEAYVLRKNAGTRRSLTAGQKVLIAAQVSMWGEPGGAWRPIWKRGRRWSNAIEPSQMPQGQAAAAMGVSVRMVAMGASLLKSFAGEPDDSKDKLIEAVEQGRISLRDACRERFQELRKNRSNKDGVDVTNQPYPVLPYLTPEAEFQAVVIDKFSRAGWLAHHFRPSRMSDVGFPDLVLVSPEGRLVLAELKAEDGVISMEQYQVIEMLRKCDKEVYIWRPSDLPTIERIIGGKS